MFIAGFQTGLVETIQNVDIKKLNCLSRIVFLMFIGVNGPVDAHKQKV